MEYKFDVTINIFLGGIGRSSIKMVSESPQQCSISTNISYTIRKISNSDINIVFRFQLLQLSDKSCILFAEQLYFELSNISPTYKAKQNKIKRRSKRKLRTLKNSVQSKFLSCSNKKSSELHGRADEFSHKMK